MVIPFRCSLCKGFLANLSGRLQSVRAFLVGNIVWSSWKVVDSCCVVNCLQDSVAVLRPNYSAHQPYLYKTENYENGTAWKTAKLSTETKFMHYFLHSIGSKTEHRYTAYQNNRYASWIKPQESKNDFSCVYKRPSAAELTWGKYWFCGLEIKI